MSSVQEADVENTDPVDGGGRKRGVKRRSLSELEGGGGPIQTQGGGPLQTIGINPVNSIFFETDL